MGLAREDDRPPFALAERVEEIALMTRIMVEATGRSGPLTQVEIDQLLEQSPAAREVQPQPQHV